MICAAIERCAGIDVGKKVLSVCVMAGPLEGEPRVESRSFGTMIYSGPGTVARLAETRSGHPCGDGKHRVHIGSRYLMCWKMRCRYIWRTRRK
jgi:hypothetical protein